MSVTVIIPCLFTPDFSPLRLRPASDHQPPCWPFHPRLHNHLRPPSSCDHCRKYDDGMYVLFALLPLPFLFLHSSVLLLLLRNVLALLSANPGVNNLQGRTASASASPTGNCPQRCLAGQAHNQEQFGLFV